MGKTLYEKSYLAQFKRIIAKAEEGVAEGMDETCSLFRDTMAQLLDFFKESARNPFLVRFLLENQNLLRKVYGPKKADGIFETMFPDGYSDACRIAGQSYLVMSITTYPHSIFRGHEDRPVRPQCSVPPRFQPRDECLYHNAYLKALSHFTKLLALRPDEKEKKDYMRKAEEISHKISSEAKEEGHLEAAAAAHSVAERIKKCYKNIG